MKKSIFFGSLFLVASLTAQAQFQGVRIVQSCEIVKFATAHSKYQELINPTQPPPSFRFGVDGVWQLNKYLSFRTGLRFAVINQFKLPYFDCLVGVTEEMMRTGFLYRYPNFELPVGIRYYGKTQNKMRPYVETFGSLNHTNTARLFFEWGFAGGIEYQLFPKLGVFLQPTYRHTFSEQVFYRTQQTRDNYGLELGVKFNSRKK